MSVGTRSVLFTAKCPVPSTMPGSQESSDKCWREKLVPIYGDIWCSAWRLRSTAYNTDWCHGSPTVFPEPLGHWILIKLETLHRHEETPFLYLLTPTPGPWQDFKRFKAAQCENSSSGPFILQTKNPTESKEMWKGDKGKRWRQKSIC